MGDRGVAREGTVWVSVMVRGCEAGIVGRRMMPTVSMEQGVQDGRRCQESRLPARRERGEMAGCGDNKRGPIYGSQPVFFCKPSSVGGRVGDEELGRAAMR